MSPLLIWKVLFANFWIAVIVGKELEFVILAKPDEEPVKPVRLGVGDAIVLFRLPVSAFCALRCCSEVAAAVEVSKFNAVPFFPNPVAKALTAGSVSEVVLPESDVLFDTPVVVAWEFKGVVDDPAFGEPVVLLLPLFDPSETF